jgi:hypothetical protein
VGMEPRRALLAATLGGAAVIHVAMVPAHAAESVPLAVAFALAGWAQALLAVAVVAGHQERARTAIVVLTAGSIGAWALSRTAGLPVGHEPWSPEAVGAIDLLCVGLEIVTLALAVGRVPLRVPAWVGPAGLVVVALSTSAALASPSATEHAHGGADDDIHVHTNDEGLLAAAQPDDGSATDADGGHSHDDASSAQSSTSAAEDVPGQDESLVSHHHGEPCTTPATAAQQLSADELASDTVAELTRFAALGDAEAAGFVPITPAPAPLVHYGNKEWMVDGRTLDPSRPESLIYAFDKQGGSYLVGAMFMAEPGETGPQVGGCLTQWHDHTNVCLGRSGGMVGVVDENGDCPAGSVNRTTGEMLHVWDIPLAGGPFSEPAPGQLRDALVAKLRDD